MSTVSSSRRCDLDDAAIGRPCVTALSMRMLTTSASESRRARTASPLPVLWNSTWRPLSRCRSRISPSASSRSMSVACVLLVGEQAFHAAQLAADRCPQALPRLGGHVGAVEQRGAADQAGDRAAQLVEVLALLPRRGDEDVLEGVDASAVVLERRAQDDPRTAQPGCADGGAQHGQHRVRAGCGDQPDVCQQPDADDQHRHRQQRRRGRAEAVRCRSTSATERTWVRTRTPISAWMAAEGGWAIGNCRRRCPAARRPMPRPSAKQSSTTCRTRSQAGERADEDRASDAGRDQEHGCGDRGPWRRALQREQGHDKRLCRDQGACCHCPRGACTGVTSPAHEGGAHGAGDEDAADHAVGQRDECRLPRRGDPGTSAGWTRWRAG